MLAVWLPLPMGAGRGLALPVLFRRCRRRKRDGTTDITQGQTRICTGPARRSRGVPARAAEAVPTAAPRPTKLALARALGGIVAGWAAARPVPVVADRLSTGRTCLDDRPAHGHLISRLRMDAALGTPPPKRRAGERGRPRRRGVRLPTPAALTTTSRHW